jgi:hypothetical protein
VKLRIAAMARKPAQTHENLLGGCGEQNWDAVGKGKSTHANFGFLSTEVLNSSMRTSTSATYTKVPDAKAVKPGGDMTQEPASKMQ